MSKTPSRSLWRHCNACLQLPPTALSSDPKSGSNSYFHFWAVTITLVCNYLSQSRLTRCYYHPVLSGILSKHRFLNMSSKYHLFLIKLYRDRSMVECHIPAIFHNDWFLNIKMSIDSFELMRPSTFCDDGNKMMVIPVRCMCALSMQTSTIDRFSIRMWHGKTPQDVKNVLLIAEASHEHQ